MQLARVRGGFPCSRLVLIRAVGRELCPGRGAEGAGSLREQEHSCRFGTASAPPALKQPFQAAPLGLVTLVAPGSPKTRCWGGWEGGREQGCGVKAAKGPRAEPPAARAEAVLLLPAGFVLEISFCKRCREKKPRSAAGWQRPGGTRRAGGWRGFGVPRGDQAGRYGDVWGGWLGTGVCGGELRVGRGKGDEHRGDKSCKGLGACSGADIAGLCGQRAHPSDKLLLP